MRTQRRSQRRSVVTGVGVVSPIGCTQGDFWQALQNGRNMPIGEDPDYGRRDVGDWSPGQASGTSSSSQQRRGGVGLTTIIIFAVVILMVIKGLKRVFAG